MFAFSWLLPTEPILVMLHLNLSDSPASTYNQAPTAECTALVTSNNHTHEESPTL
jgi:hypothetical protein